MINWYRVLELLMPHCKREVFNIDDALKHLYEEQKMSLAKIVSLTDREILSSRTLRIKLAKIGIIVRGKGGDNSTIPFPITIEELEKVPLRYLARKYNVHVATIYNRKHKMLKH